MLYNDIKIIHILSASFLLISIFLSIQAFFTKASRIEYLQKQTISRFIPLAILQLTSGFTLLSLQSISFNKIWVKGSLIGFMILMLSWLGFIYFNQAQKKVAILFLSVSIVTLLSIVFLMSSKI